jgi:hypothetical protein
VDKSETKKVAERVEDAIREIGVLLIAFAPLDVALNRHVGGDFTYLLLFLGLGEFLFVGALILERIRGQEGLSTGLLIFLIFGVSSMIMAFRMRLGV